MLKISSNQNPKYRLLKKLKTKKHRIREGFIVIEGRRIIEHSISLGIDPYGIFYCPNVEPIRKSSRDFVLEKALFDTVSDTVNSQGMIAIIKTGDIENKIESKSQNIIVLNGVQDPGNVGTIIRTADAFGFDKMILTKNTTDPHSDKALRSSMGGIFGVSISMGFETEDLIKYLKKSSYEIIVSSPSAQISLDDLKAMIPADKNFALVFGNEGNGVEEAFLKEADLRYRIDMRGGAESLNVSAAAAISMFALK